MARLTRYFVKDQPQLVVQRSNRARIVSRDADYRFYLACLGDASARYQLAIHAYAIMPDHVVLLATPRTADSLPRVMQSVGRRYVQYYNERHDHAGTLWEGRYRSTLIDPIEYLLVCCRYIELEPVRAGRATHASRYPWSSYRSNARGEHDPLVTPHRSYRRLGPTAAERVAAYRQSFRSRLSAAAVAEIHDAAQKGWALGNARYRARMEALGGRRTAPRPRGRPKRVPD